MLFNIVKISTVLIFVHSWYPVECCGGKDCHAVPTGVVQELRDGVKVPGFPLMYYTDPRLRWSEDGEDHVCSRGPSLFCVFRRPKEF